MTPWALAAGCVAAFGAVVTVAVLMYRLSSKATDASRREVKAVRDAAFQKLRREKAEERANEIAALYELGRDQLVQCQDAIVRIQEEMGNEVPDVGGDDPGWFGRMRKSIEAARDVADRAAATAVALHSEHRSAGGVTGVSGGSARTMPEGPGGLLESRARASGHGVGQRGLDQSEKGAAVDRDSESALP